MKKEQENQLKRYIKYMYIIFQLSKVQLVITNKLSYSFREKKGKKPTDIEKNYETVIKLLKYTLGNVI